MKLIRSLLTIAAGCSAWYMPFYVHHRWDIYNVENWYAVPTMVMTVAVLVGITLATIEAAFTVLAELTE